MREVATQSVDAKLGLAGGRAGGTAGLGQPEGRIVGEVFPHLAGVGGERLHVVTLQQEFLLMRWRGVFHQRVVVAEIEIAHIGPFPEIRAIRGDCDLGGVGGG